MSLFPSGKSDCNHYTRCTAAALLPLLQDQLQRGELRPVFLYKKVRTYEVPADDIRRYDPEGLSFRNMNSPADYQEA